MKLQGKLIAAVITLTAMALVLTSCGTSTANNTSSTTSNTAENAQSSDGQTSTSSDTTTATYEAALKDLVAAGTITQDQSDKVMEALSSTDNQPSANSQEQGASSSSQGNQPGGQPNGAGPNGAGPNILTSLVSSNVITQAQADAINQKVREISIKSTYESALKDLVSAGTITQNQADQVLAAVTSTASNTDQKSSTDTQAKGETGAGGFESSAVTSLVTSGVISQTQADAILKAVNDGRQNDQKTQSNQNVQNSQAASSAS